MSDIGFCFQSSVWILIERKVAEYLTPVNNPKKDFLIFSDMIHGNLMQLIGFDIGQMSKGPNRCCVYK